MRRGNGVVRAFFLGATGAALLAFSTGCSVLSAAANPKAGWALSESAPMSVIVRRAEVARATADEVDRLMTHTRVDDKSKWTAKTAIKKEDAEKLLNAAATEPVYNGQPGQKYRVVPAEAWAQAFSSVCSSESKHPNLVASLSPEVAKKYAELATQEKSIADIKASIAKEDAAIDEKGATDAAKEEHRKTKKGLEDQLDKAEGDFKPKQKELLATIKEEAGKASSDVRDRQAVAVINLRRAVDDARAANAAAMMRYPLALPQFTSDLQSTAQRVIADVIEEKTGKRPDTNGIKPEVKLDGLDVKLELNGVSADKLGGTSPGDVIDETTKRMKAYAGRVLGLMAYGGTTEDQLSFEADVLEAWSKGLKLDASKEKDAGVDVGEMKVESGSGQKAESKPAVTGRSPVGLAIKSSCNAPAAPPPDKEAAKAPLPATPSTKDSQAQAKQPKGQPETVSATFMTSNGKAVPAPSPKPATPSKKTDCDVAVTSGDGKLCL